MKKMVVCGLPIEGERGRGVAARGGDGGCRLWWLQNMIKRAPFGSKCSRAELRVLIYVAASKVCYSQKRKPYNCPI